MIDHLLITTLGLTWGILPELAGVFTDLYSKHPSVRELPTDTVDEIWIITTSDAQNKCEHHVSTWAHNQKIQIQWHICPAHDMDAQKDIQHMRELIFRVALCARESARILSCSLTGGRKTMSADIQEAARLFGCDRLLHIVTEGSYGDWPIEVKNPTPVLFEQPLSADIAQWITPVLMHGSLRADILDVDWKQNPEIHTDRFPIHSAHNSPSLSQEIANRQADSGLLANFISHIEQDERHENWRSLYRLPPRLIQLLRTTFISEKHEGLLTAIPKADIHCHIGGILSLEAQKKVGTAIWESLSDREQHDAKTLVMNMDWDDPLCEWTQCIKKGNRAAQVACILHHNTIEDLEYKLYAHSKPRIALKENHPLGFSAYELPGELTGSAVLGHPAALQPYANGIVQRCVNEGIAYLELRGSPQKYDSNNPVKWLGRLHKALRLALDTHSANNHQASCDIRFIWIADRRTPDDIKKLVRDAAQAKSALPDFLVGLDLAGDEGTNAPQKLASHFLPAFEACLPITIHAGEGESAEHIWQAAYHLHADRIGHGLTLAENAQLLNRFRDRNICLELCPSSNREVVGFADPAYPESKNYPSYPLKKLWDAGVALTLCTDNPGISRCTLAGEYLAASRMLKTGLSLWDALAMIKRGFIHSFADASTREDLLKSADAQIAPLIIKYCAIT